MPSSPDPAPTSADLDAAIHRLAADLITMRNPEPMAQTARALDGLLHYRADREAREHRARMSGAAP